MKEMAPARLLKLMRGLAYHGDPCVGKSCCECLGLEGEHEPDCELKAAIDWLESAGDDAQLVLYDREFEAKHVRD